MNKVPKIWMQLAGLPTTKKKTVSYSPRAKRNKEQLEKLAKSLGLTIKWHGFKHNRHEVWNQEGDSIHVRCYPHDCCSNMYEVEECLLEYSELINK